MTMSTGTTEEKIETVTASGKPVRERIGSIQVARTVYDEMKKAMLETAKRRARLKGLIDGNPPYDPVMVEELALSYMTNVNFLEARAILDQKAAAFFELFFEVPTLVQVRMVLPVADVSATTWCDIIAEEFSKMLLDWRGFLVNMDKARRESDAYGLGVMLWRDEWDWRPKAFSCGNFIPDAMATLDLDELPMFCLRDRVSAGDLYRWAVEDEARGVDEGWNPTAVKKLLTRLYNDQTGSDAEADVTQTSDWEAIQQRIRNAEPMTQLREFNQVKVVHLCVRETDTGEVSHYIFSEDIPTESNDGFLYRMPRRFKHMSNVLWWLPYNNGDDYLKSVRGLASMIEHHCDLSNRFLGRVFDAGFMTASLLLQPNTAADLDKLQLIRMGVVTVVPPGVQCVQSSFQPQIAPLTQLRTLSTDIMRNNTGVWKAHPEILTGQDSSQPSKTARQVAEEAAKEARVEKSGIAYDYDHVEKLYREMFRRATNQEYLNSSAGYSGQEEARQFVRRCVMRGVPLEALTTKGVFDIYATRAIGMGSWSVKLDISRQILDIRPLLDEQGQINATRDFISVRAGYQNVDRYRPLVNRDKIPSNEMSVAMLENNDTANGQPVVAGSDQTHMIHVPVHARPVAQAMQVVVETKGEGIDIPKALAILQGGGAHIEEHLKYLAQDPARKDIVTQLTRFLKAVAALIKFLQGKQQKLAAADAKAQQDQQAQLDEAQQILQNRELILGKYEIDKKMEIEAYKQQSLNQMRAEKTAEQMGISKARAQADVALKAQRQAADIEVQARVADAKIAVEQAEAAAKP